MVERRAGKIVKAPESKGVEARLRKLCPTGNGKSSQNFHESPAKSFALRKAILVEAVQEARVRYRGIGK